MFINALVMPGSKAASPDLTGNKISKIRGRPEFKQSCKERVVTTCDDALNKIFFFIC